jgi:hypothetical protein
MSLSRRNFVQASSLALLAGALTNPRDASAASALAPQGAPPRQSRSYFRDDTYTNEQLEMLYGSGAGRPGATHAAFAGEAGAGDAVGSQHMIFYYDSPADKQLTNPFNVKPSLSAGKYSLEVTILNSHVSQKDFDGTWKKFKHDAQMQLALTSPSGEGDAADDLTWTLINGIDIFLGGDGLKGIDKRLKPFVENNKPTSKFRPSERIEVLTGGGNFQLQVAAARKESWWRKLLTIGGAVLNSPLFATLPMPKFLPMGVQFANAVLNHLKDTEPLVPIWTSAKIPFQLYDGAATKSPFKFRPGLWLTVDGAYAERNLDENKNLKDHLIDVGGQFYEVKTASGQPIDANYAVLQLDFPAIK